MAKLFQVTDKNFENEVVEASRIMPVVVDFYADWCPPCRQLTPHIEAVARDHAVKLKVVAVDVDVPGNDLLVNRFDVRSIPRLLFFKDGQLCDTLTGPSLTEIKEAIDRILA